MFGKRTAKREAKMKALVEKTVKPFELQLTRLEIMFKTANQEDDPAIKYITLKSVEDNLKRFISSEENIKNNKPYEFKDKTMKKIRGGFLALVCTSVPLCFVLPEGAILYAVVPQIIGGVGMFKTMSSSSSFGTKKKADLFKRIFEERMADPQKRFTALDNGLTKALKVQETINAVSVFDSPSYSEVIKAYPEAAVSFAEASKRATKSAQDKVLQDKKALEKPTYQMPNNSQPQKRGGQK